MRATFFKSLVLMLLAVGAQSTFAQLSPSAAWATHAQNEYQVFANLTYLVASNYEAKLDIYKRRDTTGPQPTLIFIHGGGWVQGSKEQSLMSLMPWFEMGWNVVNVEYRLGRVALAPAAVEDCLCALQLCGGTGQNVRPGYKPSGTEWRIRRRTSGSYHRHDSGKRGFGPAVPRSAFCRKWPPLSTGTESPTSLTCWMVPTARRTQCSGWPACPTARRSPVEFHRSPM